jgi:hypothetical protein
MSKIERMKETIVDYVKPKNKLRGETEEIAEAKPNEAV